MARRKPEAACIFCDIIRGAAPTCTVYEDGECLVIMDIYPMSEGHCLVIPREHQSRVHELPAATRARLFELGVQVRCAITTATGDLGCDDANFIINDGPCANQEVPHVHLHVIPRRRRDHGRLLRGILRKSLLGRNRSVAHATLEAQAQAIRRALADARQRAG